MKVVVHDRTAGLPTSVRVHAERRLGRLSRHFDRVLEAEVEFSEAHQGTVHQALITVHMDGRKHPLLRARESAASAQAALDLAADKIDRQVTKLKEKIKERKRSSSLSTGKATAVAAEPGVRERESAPERIRLKLRPESLADASRALESNGKVFHVFLDEDTGGVQVAYRRHDGSLGVIEPVVP